MAAAITTTTTDRAGTAMPEQLPRLMQLASPTLPVGGFAYSQGMEWAVEAGWLVDEAATRDWLGGLLETNMGRLDLPVLARLHRAWRQGELKRFEYWNRFLLTSRQTRELRQEDTLMGEALARLLVDLGVVARQALPQRPFTFAALFAMAAVAWHLGVEDAASGYLWAWLENQVAAAVKLVPLGQTAGQRLLFELGGRIPALVAAALALGDEELGGVTTGQAIASCGHETQHTRLFRS